MKYLIMTLEQLDAMVAGIDAEIETARREGYEEGRQAEADHQSELSSNEADDAYEAGYEDGKSQGYDEGYNDGAADSYDDGYEDGRAEAELRAAEAAAFDEQPRVHEWVEGQRFFD